jgi:hypothetical protein
MHSFVKNEVHCKVFHGRIEKFFYHLGETMYLIHEKDIPFLKVGEEAEEIPTLVHSRSGCGVKIRSHFPGNNMRQRGLAESRRAMKKDMIEWFLTFQGSLDSNTQCFHHSGLADILGK